MMYLPYKEGQPGLNKMFVEMFGLVMPDKVAEAVVKRDVKTTFDPVTKGAHQGRHAIREQDGSHDADARKGWVTEASVEDTKLLPGVHRTIFRLKGGDWVASEIVKDVRSGRAKFVVNSGDVVWWGNQGRTVNESPYWKRVNETMLTQLPPPDHRNACRRGLRVGGSWVWAITRCGAIPRSRAC
jgi:hypothetical protein